VHAPWRRGEEGKFFTVQHALTGKFLSVDTYNRAQLGDVASEWELVQKVTGRRWFRGRNHFLEQQWQEASKLRVLPGKSRLTWGKACRSDCRRWYQEERDRHREQRRIAEDGRFGLTIENKVRGVCDWNVAGLQAFVHNPQIIQEMSNSLPESCPSRLKDLSEVVSAALEIGCYQSCEGTIKQHAEALTCDMPADAETWKPFFETLIKENPHGCGELPGDGMSRLANYLVEKMCHQWFAHNLFWMSHDSSPGEIEAENDMRTICYLDHFDQDSQDERDILQAGTCPEGSSCRCPRLYRHNEDTISEIRTNKLDVFIPDSAAILALVAAQVEDDFWGDVQDMVIEGVVMNTVAGIGLGFSGLGAAFASVSYVTSALIGVWQTYREEAASWTCAATVGCWPGEPIEMEGGNCRVPPVDQSGGSPFWFLPPPMVMLTHEPVSLAGLSGCTIRACNTANSRAQTVGFGADRQNVYNCQPLTYSEMTDGQQRAFSQAVGCTGVYEEYQMAEGISLNASQCGR